MLSNSENQRILVVDDDIYIRRLLSRILSEEGYTIETVADAQAMWRAFRTRTFNLTRLSA